MRAVYFWDKMLNTKTNNLRLRKVCLPIPVQ